MKLHGQILSRIFLLIVVSVRSAQAHDKDTATDGIFKKVSQRVSLTGQEYYQRLTRLLAPKFVHSPMAQKTVVQKELKEAVPAQSNPDVDIALPRGGSKSHHHDDDCCDDTRVLFFLKIIRENLCAIEKKLCDGPIPPTPPVAGPCIVITQAMINACPSGFVITKSGSYCLECNVTFSGQAAIIIEGASAGISDVHIDLRGFTISGNCRGIQGIICRNASRITIENGRVVNCLGSGIMLQKTSDFIIRDIGLTNNRHDCACPNPCDPCIDTCPVPVPPICSSCPSLCPAVTCCPQTTCCQQPCPQPCQIPCTTTTQCPTICPVCSTCQPTCSSCSSCSTCCSQPCAQPSCPAICPPTCNPCSLNGGLLLLSCTHQGTVACVVAQGNANGIYSDDTTCQIRFLHSVANSNTADGFHIEGTSHYVDGNLALDNCGNGFFQSELLRSSSIKGSYRGPGTCAECDSDGRVSDERNYFFGNVAGGNGCNFFGIVDRIIAKGACIDINTGRWANIDLNLVCEMPFCGSGDGGLTSDIDNLLSCCENLSVRLDSVSDILSNRIDDCCSATLGLIASCCESTESRIDSCCNAIFGLIESCCESTASRIDDCCSILNSRLDALDLDELGSIIDHVVSSAEVTSSLISEINELAISVRDNLSGLENIFSEVISAIDSCCEHLTSEIEACCSVTTERIDSVGDALTSTIDSCCSATAIQINSVSDALTESLEACCSAAAVQTDSVSDVLLSALDTCCSATSGQLDSVSDVLSSNIDACCSINAGLLASISDVLVSEIETCCSATSEQLDSASDILISAIDSCCSATAIQINSVSDALTESLEACCSAAAVQTDSVSDVLLSALDTCCSATSEQLDSVSDVLSSNIDACCSINSGLLASISDVLVSEIDSCCSAAAVQLDSVSDIVVSQLDTMQSSFDECCSVINSKLDQLCPSCTTCIKQEDLSVISIPGGSGETTAYMITSPGVYCVSETLNFTGTTVGIMIDSDDVTLDIREHALIGDGTQVAIIIVGNPFALTPHNRIEIKEGKITGAGSSSEAVSVFAAQNLYLHDLQVSDNGSHGVFLHSCSCGLLENIQSCNNGSRGFGADDCSSIEFRHCLASGNGGNGFYVTSLAHSLIYDCTASENSSVSSNGFFADGDCSGLVIDHCKSALNGAAGFMIDSANVVVRNSTAEHNTGFGFDFVTAVSPTGEVRDMASTCISNVAHDNMGGTGNYNQVVDIIIAKGANINEDTGYYMNLDLDAPGPDIGSPGFESCCSMLSEQIDDCCSVINSKLDDIICHVNTFTCIRQSDMSNFAIAGPAGFTSAAYVISEPGVYGVVEDLSDPEAPLATRTLIYIESDNVVLDLKEHTLNIDGLGAGILVGKSAGQIQQFEVMNGTLTGTASRSLWIVGGNNFSAHNLSMDGATSAGLYVDENGGDASMAGAIDDIQSTGSGEHGIHLANSNSISVKDVNLTANSTNGLFIDTGNSITVYRALCSSNGTAGITLTDSNAIEIRCSYALSNGDTGIRIQNCGNCYFREIDASNNGSIGIHIDPVAGSNFNHTFEDITANSHGGSGFFIEGSAQNLVFRRCCVKFGDGTGINLIATTGGNFDHLFENVVAEDFGTGFNLSDEVRGCTFRRCMANANTFGFHLINDSGVATDISTGNLFDHCTAARSNSDGVRMGNASVNQSHSNNTFDSCLFVENGGHGFRTLASSVGPINNIIRNCSAIGNSSDGFNDDGADAPGDNIFLSNTARNNGGDNFDSSIINAQVVGGINVHNDIGAWVNIDLDAVADTPLEEQFDSCCEVINSKLDLLLALH